MVLDVVEEELPTGRERRFWAFALGTAAYTLLHYTILPVHPPPYSLYDVVFTPVTQLFTSSLLRVVNWPYLGMHTWPQSLGGCALGVPGVAVAALWWNRQGPGGVVTR